jgi:flavin-dependent dehydrogenase
VSGTKARRLSDGDRVLVVGGGPAGAFFAVQLLREAKRAQLGLNVSIIERRKLLDPSADPWRCAGCNYCAGGISPRLHGVLERDGFHIPDRLVQEDYTRVWIQGSWKNFPLRVPKETRMYSVFRGSLPKTRTDKTDGFDEFLLKMAVEEGAQVIRGEVQTITYDSSGLPEVTIRDSSGDTSRLPGAFVAVSTGINSATGQDEPAAELTLSIQRLIPGFSPVKTRQTLIFELEVGRDYLNRYFDKELYFIEHGLANLRLEHIALVPKGDFLTVALIGRSIDEASLPRETRRIISEFLQLPQIKSILPRMTIDRAHVACACAPRMAAGPATHPFGDRLALIGDAVGSRLNKDGLYSAFVTAQALALTIVHRGVKHRDLSDGYGGVVKWLKTEHRYGRLVFRLIRASLSTPLTSRVLYQAFATELKNKPKTKRPLGEILWNIASGTADYREITGKLFSFRLLGSIVIGGGLITLRNILTEKFFGLRWGSYGRYPTVVVKEKRDYIKESISAHLGITLDQSPEFERMFAIRIRAGPDKIYNELGKFGDPGRDYLKLRFATVKRVSGLPNQLGSIVQYSIGNSIWPVPLRLARCSPDKTLLYDVGERFAYGGKLLFDVHPKKNGACRLVIYTAFDFRTGRTPGGKVLWRLFRVLFPEYVHDVVWNHALCCIKANAERAHDNLPESSVFDSPLSA